MFLYESKLSDSDFIEAQQYNARDAKMPDGVRARTTSHGPEAIYQRPDGVVLYAAQGDWFVKINQEPMLVLDNPTFTALFVAHKT